MSTENRHALLTSKIVEILSPPVVCIKKKKVKMAIAINLIQIDKNNETIIHTHLREQWKLPQDLLRKVNDNHRKELMHLWNEPPEQIPSIKVKMNF